MSTAVNNVVLSGKISLDPENGLRKFNILGGQVWIGASLVQRVDVPSDQTGELISVFVCSAKLKMTDEQTANLMASAEGKNVKVVGRLNTEDIRNAQARKDPDSKAVWVSYIYVDEVELVD